MATVVVVTGILFLMATMILTLVSYRQVQTQRLTGRNQAMHLADAGINEFLYQLSADYGYWEDPLHPGVGRTVGPVQMDGGTWRVVATAPTDTEPLRLTSTSTMDDGSRRTIKATVRFPTFADYVVVVDEGPYAIGVGATFNGKLHCNGDIKNDGIITKLAEAGGRCLSGSGGAPKAANYPGKSKDGVSAILFSTVTQDLSGMKSAAIASGTRFGPSGALGYKITLSGAIARIVKVTAVNKNKPRPSTADAPLGKLTTVTVSAGAVPIPADGIFYFEDDVWVEGDYSAMVTIASDKNIWCPGNLTPTAVNTNVTCGLVAESNILFPYWYETMPANQVVQAALLARTAGIGPDSGGSLKQSPYRQQDSYTPPQKASVTLKGTRAMKSMIGFSSGYDIRTFDMDPRLENFPPPRYPKLPGKDLRIDTWLEN